MNKKLFIYLIILFPFLANAEITKYIAVGTTRASLRSEGGKSDWGSYLGLGVEYSKPYSILLAVEANYATKKVTLENKTWPGSSEPEFSGLAKGDIPIDGIFFEFTLKTGYHIPLFQKKAALKLSAGPSLSLHSDYSSRIRATTYLDYDPEKGTFQFDYLRCDSEGLMPFISTDLKIGGIIECNNIGVEFRYARSFTERTCLRGLTINGKLDSFYILVRYSF